MSPRYRVRYAPRALHKIDFSESPTGDCPAERTRETPRERRHTCAVTDGGTRVMMG